MINYKSDNKQIQYNSNNIMITIITIIQVNTLKIIKWLTSDHT